MMILAIGKMQMLIQMVAWKMPYAEPSLNTMAKLETQLAKDSLYNLSWSALKVCVIESSFI